jgi:hypothetical protein
VAVIGIARQGGDMRDELSPRQRCSGVATETFTPNS